jgi:hypothetical protein
MTRLIDGYTTLLQLCVQSTEVDEDGMHLREKNLTKTIVIPIPPQPQLWLRSESLFHNLMIEKVAIQDQSVLAYLYPIILGNNRIEEIVSELIDNGWR